MTEPRSCCVFYGWVIVAVCTVSQCVAVCCAAMSPMTFLAPALVADPSTGLTATTLATIFAVANWVGATGGPALGVLFDRAGARWCLTSAMGGLGCAILGLSFCGGWVSVLVAFLVIRTIFRSALEVWLVVPINIWFSARRGRAMSAFSLGETILGGMAGMVAYEWMTNNLGWRATQRVMASLCFTIAVPCAVLLRDNPESVGCTVDGIKEKKGSIYDDDEEEQGLLQSDADDETPTSLQKQHDFTVREAMKTSAMYMIMMDSFLSTVFISGVMFFMVTIVNENPGGDQLNVASLILVPSSFAQGVTSLLAGPLVDAGVPPRVLLAGAALGSASARCILPSVNSTSMAVLYGALNGAAQAMRQMVYRTAPAKFYGRKNLGAIQSIQNSIGVVATGVGPISMAVLRSWSGEHGFAPILFGTAGCSIVLAGFSLVLLVPPTPPAASKDSDTALQT